MADAHATPHHDYHLVNPSPWPLVGSLSAFVLAIEALNTAVEVLGDHLSPAYAEFARRAKDLGSAAVFFGLSGVTIYVIAVSVVTLAR